MPYSTFIKSNLVPWFPGRTCSPWPLSHGPIRPPPGPIADDETAPDPPSSAPRAVYRVVEFRIQINGNYGWMVIDIVIDRLFLGWLRVRLIGWLKYGGRWIVVYSVCWIDMVIDMW
jgi:hypothetical protein